MSTNLEPVVAFEGDWSVSVPEPVGERSTSLDPTGAQLEEEHVFSEEDPFGVKSVEA